MAPWARRALLAIELILRLPGALYVEYAMGRREFYDLSTDPYELYDTCSSLSEAACCTPSASEPSMIACVSA